MKFIFDIGYVRMQLVLLIYHQEEQIIIDNNGLFSVRCCTRSGRLHSATPAARLADLLIHLHRPRGRSSSTQMETLDCRCDGKRFLLLRVNLFSPFSCIHFLNLKWNNWSIFPMYPACIYCITGTLHYSFSMILSIVLPSSKAPPTLQQIPNRLGVCRGFCLPPSVADNRKCVPYFRMRLSVMVCVVGRRPRRRMFLMNSGVSGSGDSRKSLRSTAKLFTFHLPNSLKEDQRTEVQFLLDLTVNAGSCRRFSTSSFHWLTKKWVGPWSNSKFNDMNFLTYSSNIWWCRAGISHHQRWNQPNLYCLCRLAAPRTNVCAMLAAAQVGSEP